MQHMRISIHIVHHRCAIAAARGQREAAPLTAAIAISATSRFHAVSYNRSGLPECLVWLRLADRRHGRSPVPQVRSTLGLPSPLDRMHWGAMVQTWRSLRRRGAPRVRRHVLRHTHREAATITAATSSVATAGDVGLAVAVTTTASAPISAAIPVSAPQTRHQREGSPVLCAVGDLRAQLLSEGHGSRLDHARLLCLPQRRFVLRRRELRPVRGF
mmetsp:Transcript_30316/g.51817  ORF Transcript_30316/g.51817 Transcript_30316/m.51817 type:complete len:215 (+) Transcript_30316:200-844(+)